MLPPLPHPPSQSWHVSNIHKIILYDWCTLPHPNFHPFCSCQLPVLWQFHHIQYVHCTHFNSLSHQTLLTCQWWLVHTLVKVVNSIFCDGQVPYLATTSGQEHQPMLPRFEWQALVSQSACSDETHHNNIDWLPVLLDISKSFPCGKVLCTEEARLKKGEKGSWKAFKHVGTTSFVSGLSFLSL